ncbi:hypothetical protein ND748_02515 [Frankia sp. AiPs1]|nr:hypothetical protein [Frankia sp. AiPs1]MCM3920555.1 hypothetical protein [Frankia sp. AiPs1]
MDRITTWSCAIEPDATLTELLGILRRHLAMDLAYLARLDGEYLAPFR